MGPDYGSWGNSVHGRTIDANVSRAYSWNVTIATDLLGGTLKIYPDRIVGLQVNRTMVNVWALSLTGQIGQTLYNKFWNPPAEWMEGANTVQWSAATNQVAKGVVSVWDKELRKHYGFSVETGNYMWETESEHFLDAYGWGAMEHTWYFAMGKLYSVGVGGILYAYDDQTGKTVWTYTLNDPFDEPVTGNNWWGWITIITDGKIYMGHLEHSAEQPIPRGAPYVCLDAQTGAEIWRVNGMFRATRWGGNAVIGDSIIATMDTYDQRVYAIGKGPSATKVAASPEVSVHGSSVLIKGSVIDTSPGTEDYGLKVRFPNGVPAVSDDSQSQWMLHVYKQYEQPQNASGVEVILEALDPNNNYYEVGRTTSDATGFYSLAFTPQVPGKYTIVARFEGSKAYYGSFAETAIQVDEAVQATLPDPTPVPQSMADLYFVPVSIGMIIAIVAVLVMMILMFRKK
jgi:outer membrane protein assembly factor BamB